MPTKKSQSTELIAIDVKASRYFIASKLSRV